MLNHYFPNLLFLGWVLIGIGVVSLILGFTWKYVVKGSKWFKVKVILITRVLTRMKEADSYLNLKDEQQKSPKEWLYLVVQYIDLNRQGSGHDDNDVYVNFQIGSGLLYPISECEYCLFARLNFAIQYTSNQVQSGWYRIDPQVPIRALKCDGVGNKYNRYDKKYENIDWGKCVDNCFIIHLGLTDESKEKNKILLRWMEEFRKEREGKECFAINSDGLQGIGGEIKEGDITTMPYPKGDKMLAKLEIGIVFKDGDENNPIPLEGSRWIISANNYREG